MGGLSEGCAGIGLHFFELSLEQLNTLLGGLKRFQDRRFARRLSGLECKFHPGSLARNNLYGCRRVQKSFLTCKHPVLARFNVRGNEFPVGSTKAGRVTT